MIMLAVGIALAVIGVPLAALGVAVARMRDPGGHCAFRRPRAAVVVALDLWDWARSGVAFLPPAPCVPSVRERVDAGLARLASAEAGAVPGERARTARVAGSHPYPPLRPTVLERDQGDGHILIDEAERIHVRPAVRDLGTLPRLRTPDDPPWEIATSSFPAAREPEPEAEAERLSRELIA